VVSCFRSSGDLRVLREVFLDFSEEARTRGFPSQSFDWFGFIDSNKHTNYRDFVMMSNLIVSINMAAVGYQAAPDASDLGVSFGHIAALER